MNPNSNKESTPANETGWSFLRLSLLTLESQKQKLLTAQNCEGANPLKSKAMLINLSAPSQWLNPHCKRGLIHLLSLEEWKQWNEDSGSS